MKKQIKNLIDSIAWCIENKRNFVFEHQANDNWYNFQLEGVISAADKLENLSVSIEMIKRKDELNGENDEIIEDVEKYQDLL